MSNIQYLISSGFRVKYDSDIFLSFTMVFISSSHPYRQEQGAVVSTTQLGHAVKKDGGHFLVLVFDKAEHLKGEAAHLALPVLKHCCLRVLITSAGPET